MTISPHERAIPSSPDPDQSPFPDESSSALMKVMVVIAIIAGLTAILLPFVSGILAEQDETVDNTTSTSNTAQVAPDSDHAPFESAYDLSEDYDLPDSNVFVVADAAATFKFLENGTGLLFLGYKECPACKAYVPMLDGLARECGVEKIVYYDVRQSRLDDPDSYAELLSILDGKGDYTEFNDDGDERIFVPFLVSLDHGEIVYMDNETSHLDPDITPPAEYWAEAKAGWVERMKPILEQAKENAAACSECSE